jgi:amino acid transporter
MSNESDLESAGRAFGSKGPGLEPSAGKYSQQLSRSLTFRENVLITLSSVTPASSVFIILPSVIAAVGGASATVFAIAALIGILVAFSYAELSSAFPITGGEYAFVARTLGKSWGFGLFLLSLVSGICIIGVIAFGAGAYLGSVWPVMASSWTGVGVILVSGLIGCLQIRTNAWVTGVFLAIELSALAVLTVLGFAHTHRSVSTLWHATSVTSTGTLTTASLGIIVAMVAVALFSYNGYGTAVYYAEETKQATKTIGKAIMWSLAITVAAELVPLVAVLLGAPSMEKLQSSSSPMNYFLLSRSGTTLNNIVSIAIAVAIINAVLAIVLQIARLLFSAARDGSWPDAINKPLASVSPRFKTPVVATLITGVGAAAIFKFVPFATLLIITASGLLITYFLVAFAALVGRRSGATAHANYKMRLFPAVPILLTLAMVVVAYESSKGDWVPPTVAIGVFVLGVIYFYGYLKSRGDRWTLPAAADEEIE